MEDFLREGTDKTPHIYLTTDGRLYFSGKSMPEDTAKFFFNIMDWLSDYFRSPAPETHLQISMRYLNSSSCSMMYKLFHFMNRLPGTGRSIVSCHWICESEDAQMKDFMKQIMDIAEEIRFTTEEVDQIPEKGIMNSASTS